MDQSGTSAKTRRSAFRVVQPTTRHVSPMMRYYPPHLWHLETRPVPLTDTSLNQGAFASCQSAFFPWNRTEYLTFPSNRAVNSVVTYTFNGIQDSRIPFFMTVPELTIPARNNSAEAGNTSGHAEICESVNNVHLPTTVCSKESLCSGDHKEKREIASSNRTCPVCHKVFGKVTTLRVHMRIHRGEKPFKCTYCEKSFSQSGNLTTHIRLHTGEKPFNCKVCSKRFSQSSALKGHMKIHLREDQTS